MQPQDEPPVAVADYTDPMQNKKPKGNVPNDCEMDTQPVICSTSKTWTKEDILLISFFIWFSFFFSRFNFWLSCEKKWLRWWDRGGRVQRARYPLPPDYNLLDSNKPHTYIYASTN